MYTILLRDKAVKKMLTQKNNENDAFLYNDYDGNRKKYQVN